MRRSGLRQPQQAARAVAGDQRAVADRDTTVEARVWVAEAAAAAGTAAAGTGSGSHRSRLWTAEGRVPASAPSLANCHDSGSRCR